MYEYFIVSGQELGTSVVTLSYFVLAVLLGGLHINALLLKASPSLSLVHTTKRPSLKQSTL